MKKRAFIILFMVVSISIFYLPYSQSAQQQDPCSKYSSNSCPSPQCQVKTNPSKQFCLLGFICFPKSSSTQICVTNPQQQNKNCFPENTPGIISEKKPTIPFDVYYEGVKTTNWQLNLVGENIRVLHPVLASITSYPLRTETITLKEEASKGNCKYYSFPYQRPQQSLTYNLPSKSSIPTTINGKPSCVYSITPITSGQSRISLIPGKPIQSLAQVCPELQRGKPLPVTQPILPPSASPELSPIAQQRCPPTEKCIISTRQGPMEIHGFKVETDECGNKKITQDNNGQPISDVKQKAEQSVKDCKDNEEQQPISELPSYCKKSKPPEIIFCKECLDYKNKFGKNKDDDFSCSKLKDGKAVSEPDGKDCKLWQNGGASPGKWDDDTYNSAWGICKNGVCVHSINALPPGKTCSCNCNGKQIGWGEYCEAKDFVCAKKVGKISGLKGNICQEWSELVCINNQGKMRDPGYAKQQCQSQGKLFYTKVTTRGFVVTTGIKKVECLCINKPQECK